MSAVPPEPQRASATPTEPASDHADGKAPPGPAGTDFGPNEWLVDELYQRYLADPGSVDMAWWNFFADYSPPTAPAAPASDLRQPQAGDAASRTPTAPGRPAASPPAAGSAAGPDSSASRAAP